MEGGGGGSLGNRSSGKKKLKIDRRPGRAEEIFEHKQSLISVSFLPESIYGYSDFFSNPRYANFCACGAHFKTLGKY